MPSTIPVVKCCRNHDWKYIISPASTMKNIIAILFVFCFSILSPIVSFSGEPVPTVYYFSTNDGVSSAVVREIVEDSLGNMWFGGDQSNRGFDLYDGYDISNWGKVKGKRDWLQNIFFAKKLSTGEFLISYTNNGILSLFDPIKKEIRYYNSVKTLKGETFSLKELKITALAVGKNERYVWVVSLEKGLFKIGLDKSGQPQTIEEVATPIDFKEVHTNGYIYVDSRNNIWLATKEQVYYKESGQEAFVQVKNEISNYMVRAIYEDKENNIFIATGKGVYTVDNQELQYIFKDKNHILNQSKVTAVYQDELNQYWFGTSEGLCKLPSLSSSANDCLVVTPNLLGKVFYTIKGDSKGGIWFSVKLSGVGYIDLYSIPFGYFSATSNKDAQITVKTVSKDKDNVYWMMTDKGLSVYDPIKEKYYHYNRGKEISSKTVSPFPSVGIHHSSSNETWIVLYKRYIGKVQKGDYNNLTFKWYDIDYNQVRNIINYAEDSHGNLWLTSTLTGLAKFSMETGKLTNYASLIDTKSNVYAVMSDKKQNTLWVGTLNKGITKIYLDKNGNPVNTVHFDVTRKNHNNVDINVPIHYIRQDRYGEIWAVSKNGYVYHLNTIRDEGFFEELPASAGIPDEYIRQFLLDNNGNLWLAGNGLYLYNPRADIIQSFNKETTHSNLFTHKGEFKGDDEYLYFSGSKGVNFISSNDFKKSPYHPSLYFSSVFLEGKKVSFGELVNNRVLLDSTLNEKTVLQLKDTEQDIKLVVRGIYPPANKQLTYYYTLDGLHKDWFKSKDGVLYFGVVPWGEYKLRVYVEDQSGNRSQEKSLGIVIYPPWWQSLWLRFLVLILLFIAPYPLYRLRVRKVEKKKARLEQLVQERTHEISTQNEELRQQSEEILSQRDHISEQHLELKLAYQDMNKLSSFGKELSSIKDVNILADITQHSLLNFMDANIFGIGVVKEDDGYLQLYTREDNMSEIIKFDLKSNHSSLSVKSFQHQKVIVAYNKKDFEKHGVDSGDIKSAVYVPLRYHDKNWGVLTVQAKKENAYSERHVALLENLSAYIASTLENIYSYGVILEKNQHIISSIQYAETIQRALLSSIEHLKIFFSDYFAFYQPKDIVSGDFYWAYERRGKLFVAVVDCTGHGVPGAFLSVIGVTLLNKLVGELKIDSPDWILEGINQEVIELLSRHTSHREDGMDMSLCVFEKGKNDTINVAFAGAKSNMRIIRKGSRECELVKGTRRSIGGTLLKKQRPFELQRRVLQKGDCIYLNTDGYIDQSNNSRKRVGMKRFVDLLLEYSPYPMEEQKKKLEEYVCNYMTGSDQRDDMTIVGIRV